MNRTKLDGSAFCAGPINRRLMMSIGGLGFGALASGTSPSLQQLFAADESGRKSNSDFSVILLWANGGPSHLETFDLKPNAPAEYRGEFKPIRTNVPGIEICELLPNLAKIADRYAIVRSLHHNRNEHSGGTCRFLSGYSATAANPSDAEYPEMASVVAHQLDATARDIPLFVANAKFYGGGPAYLGAACSPFMFRGDPNSPNFGVGNLNITQDAIQQLQTRRELLATFDRFRREVDRTNTMSALDKFNQRALAMLTSPRTAKAFDLSRESDTTRDRYGRTSWGQGLLLARRLVESGVRLVQLQASFKLSKAAGRVSNWDDHSVNTHTFRAYRERMPVFDVAVPALINDLHARGLDQRVLFVFCGEFGRTPTVRHQDKATKRPGRDHWSQAMSIFLAGALAVTIAMLALTPAALAQSNNECDEEGEAPDVIIGNLYQERRWGTADGITSFSIGTDACNIGTCWLDWHANTNLHPVIGANMYRLKDGQFEQLGQSWLKHAFMALSGSLCDSGCISTDGTHMGVNCSDPYTASRNGYQNNLGPKFEVDATTGYFPYPATDQGQTGDVIYKRLQVHNEDLDPDLNPGAQYIVDGHYVTADDALANNDDNNSSYRPIAVFQNGAAFDINVTGQTQRELPAMQAWQDYDPDVELDYITATGEGLYILGAKVTELGNGYWHYEYALQNLNSHRSVRSFSLPFLGVGDLQNVGFHDVDYHSGEPYDLTDWLPTVDSSGEPSILTWATQTYSQNPDANALRWGTIYNFRFDVNIPPTHGMVTLGMFRPGSPMTMDIETWIPGPCNLDGNCDPGEPYCECTTDCTPTLFESECHDGVDNDCDGQLDCEDSEDCCVDAICAETDNDQDAWGMCDDCSDSNPLAWTAPSEVTGVHWTAQQELKWSAPADVGGVKVDYQIVRSEDPSNFTTGLVCMDSQDLEMEELYVPSIGGFCSYLVRAHNSCPAGSDFGGLGTDSEGVPRQVGICP